MTEQTGPGPVSTIGAAEPIFVAAVLRHPLATSRAIRLLILGGDQAIEEVREVQDPGSPHCRANLTAIGPLAPGSYVFAVLDGTKEEASGIVTVE